MSDTFARLEAEKQKRILDAAMAEFAQHGYEQASTNRIVKSAGIGKGMLFHYFNSKEELFQYLVDFATQHTYERYWSRIDPEETDLLAQLSTVAAIKLEAFLQDPHLFNFLGRVYLNDMAYLRPDQQERMVTMQQQAMADLYARIDTSLFRRDVPAEQVSKMLHWVIEGYQTDLINRLRGKDLTSLDMESFWDEFYDLLAVLRRIFYEGEADGDGSA